MKPTVIAKSALTLVGSLWPAPASRIFVTILSRANLTGPNRFITNLEQAMQPRGWGFERVLLGRCRAALVVTRAPGRWFYSVCQARKIRTVLRADGFYLPEVFDGDTHDARATREMNWERIDHNQGMQDALKACDWVIYQSQFSKEQTDRLLYRRADRFSIIPNGVDLTYFRPPSSPRTEARVLALGTWRDTDLVRATLEAFRQLADLRADLVFDLVGTRSKPVDELVESFLRTAPSLAERLTLPGTVQISELPSVLRRASVALQLKSGDWCPNAVLELLASGVPVIAQEWGGTKELVGDAGIVLAQPAYDYSAGLSQSAAEAALAVLKSPEAWAEKARRQAEKFEIGGICGRYLEVLTQPLG